MKKIYILLAIISIAPPLLFAEIVSNTTPQRVLERGMRGADIVEVQKLLRSDPSLYPEGKVTGYFGALTEKAVIAFQKKNILGSTGKVDATTIERMKRTLVSVVRVSNDKVLPSAAVVVNQTTASSTFSGDFKPETIKGKTIFQPTTPLIAPLTISSGTTTEHYIIRYKKNPEKKDEDALRIGYRAHIRKKFSTVPVIAADLDKSEIAKLSKDPSIASVEIDRKIDIQDLEYDAAWGVSRIGASTTFASGVTGYGIKVAVLDTGIDYTHPELSSVYAGGYNFVSGTTDPLDDNGHGTHVAGTIAAAHNGIGVVGVSPSVQLYALKVLDANGSGFSSSLIGAIDWAIANGVQITNNSYGSSVDLGTSVSDAFAKAEAIGIISLAAAGNSGTCAGDTDTVEYPARYASVVAVGAADSNDARPCFSSTGSKVEVSAPGVSISSTKNGGGYTTMSGTSMATPHVTGVAALIAEAEKKAGKLVTGASVRQILGSTASDKGMMGRDTLYGYGIVNATNAVYSLLPATPTASTTSPVATTTSPQTPVSSPTPTASTTVPTMPVSPISSPVATTTIPGLIRPTLPSTPGTAIPGIPQFPVGTIPVPVTVPKIPSIVPTLPLPSTPERQEHGTERQDEDESKNKSKKEGRGGVMKKEEKSKEKSDKANHRL